MEQNPELGKSMSVEAILSPSVMPRDSKRKRDQIAGRLDGSHICRSTFEVQFDYHRNWRTYMNRTLSIRPSKDIRTNYAKISALTRENPVAITVNGREDTVLLSHEDFMEQNRYISELEAKLALYSHLAQGMDDIKLGRVSDLDEAFDDVLKDLEDLRP